jgi:predicted metal-dependent hydrolase
MTIRMHLENQSADVDYVISKHDQRKYLVRNLKDKDDAAKLLSIIREKLLGLIAHLKKMYPDDPRISRLQEKFDPDQLSESSANSSYTSYSVNKGEKIVFCIRQRDEQENLLDLNTMIFVAIHELAHIMTESVGHTHEFWDNMKFLLNHAMTDEVKIYQYQPYHRQPKPYCGTLISDTPLKL